MLVSGWVCFGVWKPHGCIFAGRCSYNSCGHLFCSPQGLALCCVHVSSQCMLPALLLKVWTWMVQVLGTGLWRGCIWFWILLLPLTLLSPWKHLTPLNLTFLICKMGILRPTTQSCEKSTEMMLNTLHRACGLPASRPPSRVWGPQGRDMSHMLL